MIQLALTWYVVTCCVHCCSYVVQFLNVFMLLWQVAMSVNDIVTSGAEPMFFLDYYATSKLDVDLAEKVLSIFLAQSEHSTFPLMLSLLYFVGNFDFAYNCFTNYVGYQGDCGWVPTIRLCSPRRGGEIF